LLAPVEEKRHGGAAAEPFNTAEPWNTSESQNTAKQQNTVEPQKMAELPNTIKSRKIFYKYNKIIIHESKGFKN
jgi:hypothetical protein